MAYATKADLQKRVDDSRLIQLTDFTGSAAMDDARINAALESATGTIDSYARGRHPLPLAVSEQVRDLTLDLAIYRLYQGRGLHATDAVRQAYEDALAFLKDVSAGRASLDQPTKEQAVGAKTLTKDHTVAEDQDVFDDERLKDF